MLYLLNPGRWKREKEVAVKSIKEGKMSSEDFLREAQFMKKLRHRHLIKLFAVCSDMEPFFIITEYMVNGSLLDYLRENGRSRLTLKTLINMAAQVMTQAVQ